MRYTPSLKAALKALEHKPLTIEKESDIDKLLSIEPCKGLTIEKDGDVTHFYANGYNRLSVIMNDDFEYIAHNDDVEMEHFPKGNLTPKQALKIYNSPSNTVFYSVSQALNNSTSFNVFAEGVVLSESRYRLTRQTYHCAKDKVQDCLRTEMLSATPRRVKNTIKPKHERTSKYTPIEFNQLCIEYLNSRLFNALPAKIMSWRGDFPSVNIPIELTSKVLA
jgi:hypothetical protein